MSVIAHAQEVPLAAAAAERELFGKITRALRNLETGFEVRQVITSEAHGIVVVIGHGYEHVAMRVVS